jgi:DNA helicase II / ATP-dependent DNA helicase PcrA
MQQYTLNLEQQKIINHTKGAILILAPVGTGKTLVLSERVVKAIDDGIPVDKILCLTFTNRASKEMSERLLQYLPNDFRRLTIKTFHSLCASILRIEAREIGLPADFVVYDDTDCKEIIKEIFGYSQDKDIDKIFAKITDCKSKVSHSQLSAIYPDKTLFTSLGEYTARLITRYHETLQQRHALDFADLVFYVRTMFKHLPEVKRRWQERFDFIQVDEVQDTHLSEYEIVRNLALRSGNIAMIGDLDQTIYEWRGSEPDKVIGEFQEEFKPTIYPLTYNHRSTQTLLNAVSGFADSFQERQTNITPSPKCEVGELIEIFVGKTESEEAEWIAQKIQELAKDKPDFTYNRVAVLGRTNYRVESISKVLERFQVPCITVEQYKFFNRQEIKDALAYVKFILNPFDTGAMRRMLQRPSRRIGDVTIQNIIKEGEAIGLRLTDMAYNQTFASNDPFSNLLTAYKSGTIVVFDVETTGLEVSKDEVIEIAAVKLVNGKKEAEFREYIINQQPVGNSEYIHGYSDDFLRENGRPAQEVFRDFFAFTEGAFLVGHNVGFDIKMVTAHASKAGVSIPQFEWGDTWNIANRFIKSDSYSLVNLAKELNLSQFEAHKAIDDSRTTAELLQKLIPEIEKSCIERQALVQKYGRQFQAVAQQVETWRSSSQTLRPAQLLKAILLESGLHDFYKKDEKRRLNLIRLFHVFYDRDNQELHPDVALRSIVEFTALAKNLDQISKKDNQVLMITVHQSKGLEFDTVFIAGAVSGEFPFYLSQQGDELEEEKRLFYVAMTRAKKRLFISGFLEDSRGYSKAVSQFIDDIPSQSKLVDKD